MKTKITSLFILFTLIINCNICAYANTGDSTYFDLKSLESDYVKILAWNMDNNDDDLTVSVIVKGDTEYAISIKDLDKNNTISYSYYKGSMTHTYDNIIDNTHCYKIYIHNVTDSRMTGSLNVSVK